MISEQHLIKHGLICQQEKEIKNNSKLFLLTGSFGGQISSSSFFLDEGIESCWISSSVWIGDQRKIKSNIKSVRGRKRKTTSDCYSNRFEEECIPDSYSSTECQFSHLLNLLRSNIPALCMLPWKLQIAVKEYPFFNCYV